MNTPGVKVSSRLAKIGIGFLAVIIIGVFAWPHFWTSKAAIPEIPVTHFAAPPSPIAAPTLPKIMPLVHTQATPVPQARPTPCQPCIEAANEVLQRYLKAIHDGAGADNREERQRNIYEAPQVDPNTNHPIWQPPVVGYGQSHF
jgi:hypothetical protein